MGGLVELGTHAHGRVGSVAAAHRGGALEGVEAGHAGAHGGEVRVALGRGRVGGHGVARRESLIEEVVGVQQPAVAGGGNDRDARGETSMEAARGARRSSPRSVTVNTVEALTAAEEARAIASSTESASSMMRRAIACTGTPPPRSPAGG